jgi:fructuronate reductase
MDRLSLRTLDRLPRQVVRPGYDVGAQQVGIVHLGLGAFHRAHQALYVEDGLAAGERDWAICGASLVSPGTRDALAPQDNLYTVAVASGEGETLRVVGAIRRSIVHREAPDALIRAMTDPRVRIVSLTVTEKGYLHDPATGALREDAKEIQADLANPGAPSSAPGVLVEALRRRRQAGAAPFTVLCCDNLPANGETVRRIVARLAALRDPELGKWVTGEVAFPSTMVDRIVPATTADDRARIAAALGVVDAWPVVTEPFTQWVIEDRFPQGRPRFEAHGAELVADVAPYEIMKLRLLNASHSALAYLGYLAGLETIAEAIARTHFRRFVVRLMDAEITPTLRMPAAFDLGSYKRSLLARFANRALRHRTWQIAMDGSQKLPQRLLGTIRDRLRGEAPFPCLALAVAGWMRYVTGIDERGAAIDVRDPVAATLKEMATHAGPQADRLAPALLSVQAVFGADLPRDPRFRDAVTQALHRLLEVGADSAVAELAPPIISLT